MGTLRPFPIPARFPGRFEDLVRLMPPQAITDEWHYQVALDVIDHLMSSSTAKLTKGQELYLETLVQLVQVYESSHHAIDTSDMTGRDLLDHLLSENDMNASDLGRLLKVHPSMGSKILNGERAITIEHAKVLAQRFKVRFDLFL